MEKKVTDFVSRLNRISRGLLECEFTFIALEQSAALTDYKLEDLRMLLENTQIFPKYIESFSGRFGFPLVVNGKCTGLLTVLGFVDIDPKKLVLLAELVSLVALDFYRFNEASATDIGVDMKEVPKIETNVLSLTEIRRNKNPEMLDLETLLNTIETVSETSSGAKPLLLEIPEIDTAMREAQQVAINFHERTGAWAMFSLEDLVGEVFESSSGLKDLGHVTMYISDIRKLTNLQQIRIAEQLAETGNQLQVFALTFESPSDLSAHGASLTHFIESFQHINLKPAIFAGEKLTTTLVSQHISLPPDKSVKAGKLIEFISKGAPLLH